jgi:hypothetical protein
LPRYVLRTVRFVTPLLNSNSIFNTSQRAIV